MSEKNGLTHSTHANGVTAMSRCKMILFGYCGLREGSLTVPKSSSGLAKMLYFVYIHLLLSRLGTNK